jgi:hypothetical protein
MRAFGANLFLLNLGLLIQALAPQQEVLSVRSQDSFCPGKLLVIYYKIYYYKNCTVIQILKDHVGPVSDQAGQDQRTCRDKVWTRRGLCADQDWVKRDQAQMIEVKKGPHMDQVGTRQTRCRQSGDPQKG